MLRFIPLLDRQKQDAVGHKNALNCVTGLQIQLPSELCG